MKKSGLYTTFIIGLLMMLVIHTDTLGNGLVISASSQDSSVNYANEIVFTIPVGENGIHYGGGENIDMLRWGPTALSVAPDGTFWIADAPDNHLLHFDLAGRLLDKISTAGFATSVGDLEVTSSEVWVLDKASIIPKVIHLSLDGKVLDKYDLPKGLYLEDGLTGIALGNDGSVIIEIMDGHSISQLISASGQIEQTELAGYEFQGDYYSAHPANLNSPIDPSQGHIMIGSRRIEVKVPNILGGLSILRISPDGDFFAKITEIILNTSFQVDQKIYRYDSLGNLVGMARVPISERYTNVEHGITVGSDGEVYVLITKPDRGEVQRLIFFADLSPILTPSVIVDEAEQSRILSETLETCQSREEMISIAVDYLNNWTYLDSYHVYDNPSCTERQRPRYLGGPDNYSSVPYAYGMGDTVEEFNNLMSGGMNGKFAGDYLSPNPGCGRGVDCSGLVSNAWDLPYHHATWQLDYVSIQLLNVYQLQPGDILNWAYNHTIIFESFEENGFIGYEAVAGPNYDRVLQLPRLFEDIPNYVPRRYNNVCYKILLPIVNKGLMQEVFTTPSENIIPDSDPYPPPNP